MIKLVSLLTAIGLLTSPNIETPITNISSSDVYEVPKAIAKEVKKTDIVIRIGEYDNKPGKRVYIDPDAINIPEDIEVNIDEKGFYIHEYDINLKLGSRIHSKLIDKGVNAILQVSKDKSEDLNAAGIIANKTDADIYLSVHHNANDSNTKGYMFMVNKDDFKSDNVAARLSSAISENGLVDSRHNQVNEGYIGELNVIDKSIAVLGEFGYFDNIEELQNIMSDEYVEYISDNISDELVAILKETN